MILPKKQAPQAALNRLAEHLDEKAYTEIERTDPMLASILAEVIEAGMKPDGVFRYVNQRFPNRWAEAQQVRQAARYLERER